MPLVSPLQGSVAPHRMFESASPYDTVRIIQQQIQDLLDTGVYEENKDPIIMTLRGELAVAERALGSM